MTWMIGVIGCAISAAVSLACGGPNTLVDGDIAFVEVNVLPMDRERVLEEQTVIIDDGRIVAIGSSDEIGPEEGVKVIESDGRYLMQVGELGNGPGQLGAVHAVTLGPDGNLYVANVCGTNLHPYVTVPGQIAEARNIPIPNCVSRFDVFTQAGDYLGPWDALPEPGLPLSVAAYGDRLYAGVSGAQRGRQDLVVVDAETQQVVERITSANVYVHQMAMDQNGDIYVASVYPEHGGELRGIEGPSFVRWAKGQ